jgi:5'-nucleotidase
MNRRTFIKTSTLASAGVLVGAQPLWAAPSQTVTILHTNDMHSRIEAFPDDGGRNANQGGMLKLAALVQKVKSENSSVLLLDSGDAWQGTPYFNLYRGELEFKLMSKMGYDASTLGNHEFDNGLEGIMDQLPHAGFPHLCANYDFSKTILSNKFSPYRIFKKNGIRIGVFGLGIALDGLVNQKNYGQTRYLDPVEIAQEMVQELKAQKCHAIICLSHLGYSYNSAQIDDRKLASQVSGIDLILGGHTHTFMERPAEVQSIEGHTTLIHHAGTGALILGKIDLRFSRSQQLVQTESARLRIY